MAKRWGPLHYVLCSSLQTDVAWCAAPLSDPHYTRTHWAGIFSVSSCNNIHYFTIGSLLHFFFLRALYPPLSILIIPSVSSFPLLRTSYPPYISHSMSSLYYCLLFNHCVVLVGKPGGKRPLERPRRRWEDNIKMDLQEVGRGGGDWMGLTQDRDRWRALVSTVMNFRVP